MHSCTLILNNISSESFHECSKNEFVYYCTHTPLQVSPQTHACIHSHTHNTHTFLQVPFDEMSASQFMLQQELEYRNNELRQAREHIQELRKRERVLTDR